MKLKGAFTAAALLGLAVIVSVSSAASWSAANIADLSWDESNLSKLRSFDKDEVFDFLDQTKDNVNDEAILLYLGDDARCIKGFTWVNLAGDHHYDLVVVFEPEGTSLTNIVAIYRRNSSGKIAVETIGGDGIALGGDESLGAPELIQDLDHDGKDELIVPEEWGSPLALAAVISIKVYRLIDGEYVEASRDFPKFYDEQILPKLESEIAQIKRNPSSADGLEPPAFAKPPEDSLWEKNPERKLALFEMDRDKILRTIGRDPKAGEEQAREWVKSGDEILIGYAMSIFQDMADEPDFQAAKSAWKRTVHENLKHETAH